jgi:hypothetical protein
MPKLYSYCIPYDDGAAPNPYWGVCTLVICKPAIRRSAVVGDWIVGTGSTRSPIGDISGCVVYAMQVTDKMTMARYDAYTAAKIPGKVPNWTHRDVRCRLGDSLYDFSVQPPQQRHGVHGPGNIDRDFRGQYALLSEHFFYFGDKPERLPNDLLPIVRQGQGHQCNLNAPHFERFVTWIHSLGYKPNTLMGKPQLNLFKDESIVRACGATRCQDADDDEVASRSLC